MKRWWLWLYVLWFLLAQMYVGPAVNANRVFGFIPAWYLWETLIALCIIATHLVFIPDDPYTDVPEKEVD